MPLLRCGAQVCGGRTTVNRIGFELPACVTKCSRTRSPPACNLLKVALLVRLQWWSKMMIGVGICDELCEGSDLYLVIKTLLNICVLLDLKPVLELRAYGVSIFAYRARTYLSASIGVSLRFWKGGAGCCYLCSQQTEHVMRFYIHVTKGLTLKVAQHSLNGMVCDGFSKKITEDRHVVVLFAICIETGEKRFTLGESNGYATVAQVVFSQSTTMLHIQYRVTVSPCTCCYQCRIWNVAVSPNGYLRCGTLVTEGCRGEVVTWFNKDGEFHGALCAKRKDLLGVDVVGSFMVLKS